MSRGIKLATAVAVSVVGVAVIYGGTATSSNQSKIEGRVLRDTAGGNLASIVINLKAQANLSAAYKMRNQDARGWYVYKTLKAEAARTQAPVKAMLASRGRFLQVVLGHERDLCDSRSLAGQRPRCALRRQVDRVKRQVELAQERRCVRTRRRRHQSPDAIEPGVNQVNAPGVWALGFTGQGIVVGNQDTGHALDAQRAQAALPRLERHDRRPQLQLARRDPHAAAAACGPNTLAPATTTATARTPPAPPSATTARRNQIGVAPGAKWIGCRNMDQGNGTPATYTECFQFFIAPTDLTGQNPDPTLRPARDEQ